MAWIAVWNQPSSKYFESGLDRPMLYLRDGTGAYPLGVPWEGLINVTEKPGGAEVTDLYANNAKYAQLVSVETFEGSIEAYTFPDDWLKADGILESAVGSGGFVAQQTRQQFGLSYRTYVGSDAAGAEAYYKLHLLYGCLVSPSEAARNTINESPEAATFSWEFSSTPVAVTGFKPTSHMILDSRTVAGASMTSIESLLYGETVGAIDPALPLPDAIIALL